MAGAAARRRSSAAARRQAANSAVLVRFIAPTQPGGTADNALHPCPAQGASAMAATINTNIASLTAQRNLGLRINSAKDDAAGLAISERFSSQIRGLDQAARNANDGISLAQVTEGAMKSASDILQRVREVAVQWANASNSPGDRQALNQEVGQLVSELDRIAQTTEFNGAKLLDGSFGTQQFQVGANANQTLVAATANLRTSRYGNNQNTSSNGAGVSAATAAWGTNGVTTGTLA